MKSQTLDELHRIRRYVERAIRRIKVFKILCHIVPVSLVKKVDDILIVPSALFNLGSDLIKYYSRAMQILMIKNTSILMI